jgi:hypothetical protein
MITNAYVVQASSGEYSDRQTWTAAVYLDLADARLHADLASAEARRRDGSDVWGDDGDYSATFKACVAQRNPYDCLPLCDDDDDRADVYREGIDYHVDTVRLFGEVPS